MAKRHHPCDICGYERKRWQRLCGTCWAQLPHYLRTRIIAMYRIDKKAWRAATKEGITLIGDRVQRHMAAYARTAAQLGERDA